MLKIDLGFAKLVVDTDDHDGFKDVFIGLEDKDGSWSQDLVHVGNSHIIDDDLLVHQIDGEVKVHVYSDENDEDYTHEFVIKKHKEEN